MRIYLSYRHVYLSMILAISCITATISNAKAQEDPLPQIIKDMPEDVVQIAILRRMGVDNLAFSVVRLTDFDRLFVNIISNGAVSQHREIVEIPQVGGRITDIRAELESGEISCFIDIQSPEGELTYELFLNRDLSRSYIFQPASN